MKKKAQKKPRARSSLVRAFPLMKKLSQMREHDRQITLEDLEGQPRLYKALHEVAHNTLKGRLKLTPRLKNKLSPHKRTLEELCKSKNAKCSRKRKALLVQSGGLFPLLVPILGAVASALLSKAS